MLRFLFPADLFLVYKLQLQWEQIFIYLKKQCIPTLSYRIPIQNSKNVHVDRFQAMWCEASPTICISSWRGEERREGGFEGGCFSLGSQYPNRMMCGCRKKDSTSGYVATMRCIDSHNTDSLEPFFFSPFWYGSNQCSLAWDKQK